MSTARETFFSSPPIPRPRDADRRGRQFFSPQGTGLYLTFAMPMQFPVEAAPSITAYAAVCVCKAIETLTGKQGKIKWVNDVFLGGKKICGILSEASTSLESGMIDMVLIGIGINVVPCSVPVDLKNIVGFLDPQVPIRNQLAAAICNELLAFEQNKTRFLDGLPQALPDHRQARYDALSAMKHSRRRRSGSIPSAD